MRRKADRARPGRLAAGLFLAVTAFAASAAMAQTAGTPGPRPYQSERYDEDWSAWRKPSKDPTTVLPGDSLKAIPVGGAGWLTVGGDLRIKAESLDHPVFGLTGAKADSWLMTRMLLHADLHLNPRLRGFVQLGYHHVAGRDAPFPFDNDGLDFMQAFVEGQAPLGAGRLSLRLGRQEIQAGSRKFWGNRQPVNIRAAFDGARIAWRAPAWRFDATYSHPVQVRAGGFDDRADRSVAITTARVGHDLTTAHIKTDLFFTRIDRSRYTIQGVPAPDDRRTLGLRLEHAKGPWSAEVELLAQRGVSGPLNIKANGGWAEVRYDFADRPLRPRLGLRALWGSGDGDPGDGTLGVFDPTFPYPANDSGLSTFANAITLAPVVTVQPTATSRLEMRLDTTFRAEAADALYAIPAFPINGTRGLPGGNLVTVSPAVNGSWQVTPQWSVAGQAAYMIAEGALQRRGGRDTLYLAVWSSVRF